MTPEEQLRIQQQIWEDHAQNSLSPGRTLSTLCDAITLPINARIERLEAEVFKQNRQDHQSVGE